MNILNTKRGLNLAAILLGTSSMMAPSLQAYGPQKAPTQAEKNTKSLMQILGNSYTGAGVGDNYMKEATQRALSRKGGIILNFQNDDGNTLLHLAAEDGARTTVQLLIDLGAPLLIKNEEGKIALDLAREPLREGEVDPKFYSTFKEIVNILEQAQAMAPRLQAQTQEEKNARDLIKHWPDPTTYGTDSLATIIRRDFRMYSSAFEYKGYGGNTLLHLAVKNRDLEAVQVLVYDLWDRPNIKNDEGETALDLARKLLREAEADPKLYSIFREIVNILE